MDRSTILSAKSNTFGSDLSLRKKAVTGLFGFNINGNLKLTGGTTICLAGATVAGNLKSEGDSRLALNGTIKVGGNVRVKGAKEKLTLGGDLPAKASIDLEGAANIEVASAAFLAGANVLLPAAESLSVAGDISTSGNIALSYGATLSVEGSLKAGKGVFTCSGEKLRSFRKPSPGQNLHLRPLCEGY